MAKRIKDASLVITHPASNPRAHLNVVRCTVEMPASELAAFLVLAGLTNDVTAAVTTPIAALGDNG